ncbi:MULTISPECIES: cytochrome c nitrite reductase small subunit [Anaerolinea]|uniref:cytochrome c nitrite reductase small subunit n=1 Tax=Anaerolinea TaxID=233189 RepID=UPI002619349B|nr:cytochrome c nitrite reductase small subunit [Anaerolinea thermophila]
MRLPIIVGVICLIAVLGVGMWVSNFTVYLGDDPTTCNNCHVMDDAYEGWYHAGHKAWATCNDCHTPHALIPKYLVKARSGFNHVTAFTLGHVPSPLRAKPSTDRIIQENCIRCHEDTVETIMAGPMQEDRYCFECHRSVAHGPRGISILPYQDKTR